MKLLNIVAVIVVLVTAITTCACNADSDPGDEQTEILKIGVMAPVTGGAAAYGLSAYRLALLEAERINSEGGINAGGKNYVIELVLEDTQYSPSVGVMAAEKLISQGDIEFIIGPMSSTVYNAVWQMLNSAGIIHLQWTSADWSLGPDKPYGFRSYQMVSEYTYPCWTYIAENYPEVQNIAIITVDDETGRVDASLTKRACEEFGINVVKEVYTPRSTREFYSLFAPVLAEEPDLIDCSGMTLIDLAYLTKQLRESGYTGYLHVSHQLELSYMVSVAGEALDGFTCVGLPYEDVHASSRMTEMKDSFIAKWGEAEYAESSLVFFDTLGMLVQGIEEADSIQGMLVKAALEGMVYESPIYGTCEFGGYDWYGVNHQIIQPITIGQIQDGKFVTIHEYPKDEVVDMLTDFYSEK